MVILINISVYSHLNASSGELRDHDSSVGHLKFKSSSSGSLIRITEGSNLGSGKHAMSLQLSLVVYLGSIE